MPTRPTAVAGTWYPGSAGALTRQLDAYIEGADVPAAADVHAVFAPHAGLMFSGPVGAYSYKFAAQCRYDVVFVIGPSHYFGFEGVSVWPSGAFESPLGAAPIDEAAAADLLRDPVAHVYLEAHGREHAIEMQVPFLRRLLPDVPLVPALMGIQRRATIDALAAALVAASRSRRALLVASTDLSHYFDAPTAAALDARVQECVLANDAEALMTLFEQYPEAERGRYVACGGGPAIAVMKAARALGAQQGHVLKYAHSGEVSGDYDGVVGYLSAAFNNPARTDAV